MSMTVGDSIIGDRVYRSCVVTINGFDIVVDIVLFDMVDLEVILGIEWLSHISCYLGLPCKDYDFIHVGVP